MILPNHIARFFDHHYLWKQSISILDFLHGDIHEAKVASDTTTFGWMCPSMLNSVF